MSKRRFTSITFAGLIALTAAVGVAASSRFGVTGQKGYDGSHGLSGRDGQALVATATGQPLSFNLSGQLGMDGSDGRDGENAYSCRQPAAAEEDLYGADGGEGGDAGVGGQGGNGGDITIYTDDVRHLGSVYVVADGGRGGRSGRPGYGGRPCFCQTRTWVVKKCNSTGTDICKDLSFSCRDGSRGRDGSPSTGGRSGERGTLTVINQLGPIAPSHPTLRVPLMQILQGPFTVSENIWLTKYGANQLLAHGSRVADTYRQFDRHQEYQIQFAWEDRRPMADFARYTMDINASLNSDRAYGRLSSDIWYQAREESRNGILTMVFEKVIYEREAEQLHLSVSGSSSGIVAFIDDSAGMSDLVHTSLYVKVSKEKFLGDKKLYEGALPAHLLSRNGQRFALSLGQIPGIDLASMGRGNTLKISVDATRALGGFSKTKNISLKYRVP